MKIWFWFWFWLDFIIFNLQQIKMSLKTIKTRDPPTTSVLLDNLFIRYCNGGEQQEEIGLMIHKESLARRNILDTDTLEDIGSDKCLMMFLKQRMALGLSREVDAVGFAVKSVYRPNNSMFITDYDAFFTAKLDLHTFLISKGYLSL